jgi:hypothetical protein
MSWRYLSKNEDSRKPSTDLRVESVELDSSVPIKFNTAPVVNNANTEILTRNSTTGNIETKTSGGGAFTNVELAAGALGYNPIFSGAGTNDVKLKGIFQGNNMTFSNVGDDIRVDCAIQDSAAGDEPVLSSDVIRRLTAGTGISLTSDLNQITISSSSNTVVDFEDFDRPVDGLSQIGKYLLIKNADSSATQDDLFTIGHPGVLDLHLNGNGVENPYTFLAKNNSLLSGGPLALTNTNITFECLFRVDQIPSVDPYIFQVGLFRKTANSADTIPQQYIELYVDNGSPYIFFYTNGGLINSGVVLNANQWYKFRLETNSNVDCEFFLDDVSYGTLSLASNTTDLYSVGVYNLANQINADVHMLIDYMKTEYTVSR